MDESDHVRHESRAITLGRGAGHQPAGASKAQRFYDRSQRLDAQRDAVERVSAELERIRRREPRVAAPVVPLRGVPT